METIQIREIKKYLKNHSKVELASKLGYKSSNAIDQWLLRGNVPIAKQAKVLKIVRKK